MSWIQKLYETYENCSFMTGTNSGYHRPLLPLSHIVQQAQIEIILDGDGLFKTAIPVPKEEAATIIPCTEGSGSRSGSDPKAHPLSDKLQYIAADLSKYINEKKGGYFDRLKKMHLDYLKLLREWCQSPCSHEKANAVLKYVERGKVIEDLISVGILKKDKIKDKDIGAIVRWVVQIPGDDQDQLWNDQSLFESWSNFDRTLPRPKGLCYVTGKIVPLAINHPKYLRSPGDSAKLISSNDKNGFTFRGRVSKAEQACGVGYEVTQKAHSVLIWLLSKQGKVFFEKKKQPGLAIVAWATSGSDIPNIIDDGYSILGLEGVATDAAFAASTAESLALRLKKRINGYGSLLGKTNNVVVMGMNSITKGRLAITFYRELSGADFLLRVDRWHESCSWVHNYKQQAFVGAPSPKDIAEVLYGRKENGVMHIDGKIQNMTIERLLPCIIDSQKIPRDLMEMSFKRAINRAGIADEIVWNKTLSIACALFRKYAIDYKGVEYGMALDQTRKTRDYLYGRLLAMADNIEQWALREAEENRQTGAARLMQRFADHPYTTWRTLELSLVPYKAKLGKKSQARQNLITEIMTLFEPDEFINDQKLNGEFLLGYHCQRDALSRKNKDKNDSARDQENCLTD